MVLETLSDAFTHSVQVRMWCSFGPYTKAMKRGRECHFEMRLDMMTLVATRGRDFPISRLRDRLRCPRCGSTEVRLFWEVPTEPKANAQASMAPDYKASRTG